MPLHPQVAQFLELQRSLGLKPIDQCTPAEFRAMMQAGKVGDGELEPVDQIENRDIDGPNGPIPIRIYRSTNQESKAALVYYHGGGWVGGDLDTHEALCRSITNAANCTVIAVDYRLAPEYQYPAAAADSFDCFAWVCQNCEALNLDPEKIAVGGDSAGGNLAAVVSLMARDRNHPLPCQQILIYPIVNCDLATPSYQQYAEGYSLTAAGMKWFWQHYAPDVAQSKQPSASPLLAADLTGLPPALVILAEYDVLRSEGEQYATRLQQAGIPTQQTQYPGMIHGFVGRIAMFDLARQAVQQIAVSLQSSFQN
jgi:acetyl esterase